MSGWKAIQQAFEGLKARLGEDHHYTLTAAINLASDHVALDQLAQARAIGVDALRRLNTLLGPTHAHTLGCAANLALDMIASRDEEDGKELQDKTLRLLADTHGESSPDYEVAANGNRLDSDFDPPAL
jgi:hypothetical protein